MAWDRKDSEGAIVRRLLYVGGWPWYMCRSTIGWRGLGGFFSDWGFQAIGRGISTHYLQQAYISM